MPWRKVYRSGGKIMHLTKNMRLGVKLCILRNIYRSGGIIMHLAKNMRLVVNEVQLVKDI